MPKVLDGRGKDAPPSFDAAVTPDAEGASWSNNIAFLAVMAGPLAAQRSVLI